MLGHKIIDSTSAATFTVTGVDSSSTNISGWYVTATATYKLQGNDNLSAGSITSQLSTPIAL